MLQDGRNKKQLVPWSPNFLCQVSTLLHGGKVVSTAGNMIADPVYQITIDACRSREMEFGQVEIMARLVAMSSRATPFF